MFRDELPWSAADPILPPGRAGAGSPRRPGRRFDLDPGWSSRGSRWLVLLTALAGVLTIAWACVGGHRSGTVRADNPPPDSPVRVPRTFSASSESPIERAPRPDPRSDGPSFAVLLEQLVELSVAKQRHRDSDPPSDIDEEIASRVQWILHHTSAPEAAALRKLSTLMSEDTTVQGRFRRAHSLDILERVLQSRYTQFLHSGRRRLLNRLVEEVLGCIPLDEVLAENLTQLLTNSPFLDVSHEPAILELAATAMRDRYLVPLVVRLLSSVWINLVATNARSARELANLALLFRSDRNPVKRLAALRHLLTAADGRYRESVLGEVLENRDSELARALVLTAANGLPPAQAISTLQRLGEIDSSGLVRGLEALAGRHPEALVTAYQRLLKVESTAAFREQLVTAAGRVGGLAGSQLVRRAARVDPNPAVRQRAKRILSDRAKLTRGRRRVR